MPHDSPEQEDAKAASGQDLAGRRVVAALSGGIACYKTATLVSRLVQRGADVRVLMTEAATRFITPLTLQALSGRSVLSSPWQHDEHPDSQHVGVARWCELMVIAPASADNLARLAQGLCDDVVCLTAAALPRATPLVLAPAMNAQMWENPVTQRNIQALHEMLGCTFVGPEAGWQACRTEGAGRMSEPEAILDAVVRELTKRQGGGAA